MTTCMWFTHTNTQNWCYNRTVFCHLRVASSRNLYAFT